MRTYCRAGFRVFYWLGARYDLSLLAQASLMIFVQVLVLHVALTHRPAIGAQHSLSTPFSDIKGSGNEGYATRPFKFWQWRSRRPYWEFIAYYSATLALLQLFVGTSSAYVQLQGVVALSVEAILPIPQILENQRSQSCKGFRLSVLINWLVGDTFKMTYFFLSDGGVPWAFKMCGLFQSACDAYLGVQYFMYDYGRPVAIDGDVKDVRLA